MDQGDVTQIGDMLLKIASQAQGDILYYNGTNWVRLPAGTTGQHLRTNGGGGNPAWETVPLPTDLNITSQATGDILYFDGANWVRLAAGTSGNLLQTNGAAAPTWVAPPSAAPSGALIWSWGGFGAAAQISTTDRFTTTVNEYELAGGNIYTTGTNNTVVTQKYIKRAAVDNIAFVGRLWSENGSGWSMRYSLRIGGVESGTVTIASSSGSPTWGTTIGTLDISSLSDDTIYDIEWRIGHNRGANARVWTSEALAWVA